MQAGRWLALASVLITMCFSDMSGIIFPQSRKINDITQLYYTHFVPADYVFSIWGLIYLSFIVYAVYQVLPKQRNLALADRLVWPFTLANLLGAAWVISFTASYITLSMIIICCMLALAFFMFQYVKEHSESLWIQFPFGIYFGWMTVATAANLTTWMAYNGFSMINDPDITDACIALVCGIGILVSYLYRDLFYPAVVCWAVLGIYIKNKYMVDKVATSAFIATIVMFVWIVSYTIFLYASMRRYRKPGALNN